MDTKRKSRPRKTDYGQYTVETINRAVNDVIVNRKSIRAVARDLNLSFKTVARYVKKRQQLAENEQLEHVGYKSNKRVFSDNLELELKQYIKLIDTMNCGVTQMDARKAAYAFARNSKVEYPKEWDRDDKAGVEWLKYFRGRHPDLKFKKPERSPLFSEVTVENPPDQHSIPTCLKKSMDQ